MKWWLLGAALGCLSCSKPVPGLPQLRLDQLPAAVAAEVKQAYETARVKPRDATATGRLGMILHALEQYGAAGACYQRAGSQDSKAFSWPYYEAVVMAQQGDSAAAVEALGRALRADPDYRPAQRRMAQLLFDLGRLDQSEQWYRKGEDAHSWYGLGRVQAARGDMAAAAVSYRKACGLFPSFGAAHYALAMALRKQNQAEEAERHLALSKQHQQAAPPSDDPLLAEVSRLNRTAANYVRDAVDLEAQGKLAEAVELHLRAIESDPKFEQAHINLISLYGRLGQPDKAEEHYRAAVALNPNRAECYYNYGVLQFARNRPKEARAAFERALGLDPRHAESHHNLGYLLEMEGRPAEALGHYRKALDSKPDYRLARFHLGGLLLNQRQYPEAIAHLEQTVSPEDENTPGYWYALGVAYGRSGDRVRAAEWMGKARQGALTRGQAQLASSIEKDLALLARAGTGR